MHIWHNVVRFWYMLSSIACVGAGLLCWRTRDLGEALCGGSPSDMCPLESKDLRTERAR
jgi:hypothetical protein